MIACAHLCDVFLFIGADQDASPPPALWSGIPLRQAEVQIFPIGSLYARSIVDGKEAMIARS